jgi:soluble cytochrome b562
LEVALDPNADIRETLWFLRQSATALQNYFSVHMIKPERVERETYAGDKIVYEVEGVTPRPGHVFREIEADAITVGMFLRSGDWEKARAAAENIKRAIDEVEPVIKEVTDQNIHSIFEDMKTAANYLVNQLKETREHPFQLSPENMAYWIVDKTLSALQALRSAVEDLKNVVGDPKEIASHPRIAKYIEEGIKGLEEDINYWEQAMKQGKLVAALKAIDPEQVIQLTYKFVYQPLVQVLPKEKLQNAQNHLWRIFLALAALRNILGMLS